MWLVVCEVLLDGRSLQVAGEQSHCLERPALGRHHDLRGSHFHQVSIVDFPWLSSLPFHLPLAVLGRSQMGSSFCWQSPLAARGTVGCRPGWGGTRAWAPGTGWGGTGLDKVGFGCLCVFSAIKHSRVQMPWEQKHSYILPDWIAAAMSSCSLKLQVTNAQLSSSLSKVPGFLSSVQHNVVDWIHYCSAEL